MPINMPTRVNRVPRLGQPATQGGPFPQVQNGAQPPVNRYNTPNMNTYVTPDNRIAAGYGNDLGIDRMVQQHRQQQAQNGYSQWDRDRLRLGTAPPVMDAAAPQPPGAQQVLGREVAPYGSVPASGQRSVSMGPIDQRAADIANRQKLAFAQLMARRSAMMTGRPLREKFQTPSAQQQAALQPQTMYVDGHGEVMKDPAQEMVSSLTRLSPVPAMQFRGPNNTLISPFDMPGRAQPLAPRRQSVFENSLPPWLRMAPGGMRPTQNSLDSGIGYQY